MMLLKDAMGSWWVHPLVTPDGTSLWVGAVDRHGSNWLLRVNCDGSVNKVPLAGPGEADDHNAAAVVVDPAQPTLITAYSRHNLDTHVRVQRVNRTTLAVEAQQTIDLGANVTYAQLWYRPGRLVLAARAGTNRWRYVQSTDWGANWSPHQTLLTSPSGQHYVAGRQHPSAPDVVHLISAGHPVVSTETRVGYCRLDLVTGEIRDVTGTLLGDLDTADGPDLAPDDLSQAITPSSLHRVRALDVGVVDEQPAIAYAVWSETSPPRYKIKRWSGSAWVTEGNWELATGEVFGHNAHYHGGVAITDTGNLVTSRESGGVWAVESWTRSAPGWTFTGTLASGETKLIRPYAARGAETVIWQDALWETYRRYYGDTVD